MKVTWTTPRCDFPLSGLVVTVKRTVYTFQGEKLRYRLVVPADFQSDGASVPRLARALVPSKLKTMPQALLHDYFYKRPDDVCAQLETQGVPVHEDARKLGDKLLDEVGAANPATGWWAAWVMWAGVRLGGWAAWNAHRRQDAAHVAAEEKP